MPLWGGQIKSQAYSHSNQVVVKLARTSGKPMSPSEVDTASKNQAAANNSAECIEQQHSHSH